MLLIFNYESFFNQDSSTILAERLQPFSKQLPLLLRRLYFNAENPVEPPPALLADPIPELAEEFQVSENFMKKRLKFKKNGLTKVCEMEEEKIC